MPVNNFLYHERTQLKEGASLSLKEIIESLDQRFDFFLRRSIKDEQYEPRKAELTILQELIKNHQLSDIIKKAFADELDFSSENKLDGDTIRQLLLNTFLFLYPYKLVPEPEIGAQENKTTPLEYMGKKIFEDERVTLPMMYEIEKFFTDFADQLFEYINDPTEELKAVKEKFKLLQEVNKTLDFITSFATLLSQENSDQLVQAFNNAVETIESASELRLFLRSLVKILEESKDELPAALMNKFKNIFEIFAPDAWIRAETKRYFHLVYCQPAEKKGAYVLHAKNFYFEEPAAIDNATFESDELPTTPQLLGNEKRVGGKDISLFKEDGTKVYWGDLSGDDISKLRGRYYLLSQTDSIFKVPDFALVESSGNPAYEPTATDDAFRLSPRPNDITKINPNYMRIVALGKIENGKYVKNVTNETLRDKEFASWIEGANITLGIK